MKSFKICAVSILFALTFISCDTSKSYKTLSLDEVINNYYEAIGGYDVLKGIKTKITIGTYIEPGYGIISKGKTVGKRGEKGDIRMVNGKGKLIGYFFEAYDGDQVWEYYRGDTIPRIMSGEARKAAVRGAEFDESFVDYELKGHKAKLYGLVQIDGIELYQINVTLSDGWEKIYYLDKETFLIKAMKKSMPLHARGDDINFLVFYDQYREVDGIMMPFVSVERNMDKNFEMVSVRVLDEIILNENLDSFKFKPHIPNIEN